MNNIDSTLLSSEKFEYAEKLRIGELKRDASDSIKGFLYQDLMAIDLILKSNTNDKVYVEWVEDIFVENNSTISVYQIKYYPKSVLIINDILVNLFYQYLKFKLYEDKSKKFVSYCIYHSNDKNINNDKAILKKQICKENDLKSLEKININEKLVKCSDMSERKSLLYHEVASTALVDEFKANFIYKNDFLKEKAELKNLLYQEFILDDNLFPEFSEDNIKDILFSISIQFIQKSYYDKPEVESYDTRFMTKTTFKQFVNGVLGSSEEDHTNRIKYIFLGYIDETFHSIIMEMENYDIIEFYRKIYINTKTYFSNTLGTSEKRFKLINSISTDSKLNKEEYLNNISKEQIKFYEHKEKIQAFLKTVWKIMYDINTEDLSNLIKESEYYYFFNFPDEVAPNVVILSAANNNIRREAYNYIKKIIPIKLKPGKWYLSGRLKGLYEYSYPINSINDVKINEEYNINHIDNNKFFYIECLNCIDCDLGMMERKDDTKCLFGYNCKEAD